MYRPDIHMYTSKMMNYEVNELAVSEAIHARERQRQKDRDVKKCND